MSNIAESFQILYDIKEDIRNSIEEKGVTVGDAPFTDYASKINEIVVDPMDGSYDEGYAEGFTQGDNEGYNRGFDDGRSEGESEGYNRGFDDGRSEGETEGYNNGYADGTTNGISEQKGKLTTITVDENGVYSREDGYKSVEVAVPIPTFETTELMVSIESNGQYRYEPPKDGYSLVNVGVNVDTDFYYEEGFNNGFSSGKTEGQTEGYNSGYGAGKTDGISEGYGNGYNAGRTDGYEIGKTDGENAIKANMQSITITQNGPYSDERGYKQVIVNVVGDPNAGYDEGYSTGYGNGYADGYTSGTTDGGSVGYNKGVTDTKTNMKTVTMTKNGVYSDENGYKEVTVSVDVETPYNNGYTSGRTDGKNEIINNTTTLNVTENGSYRATNNQFYKSVLVDVDVETPYNEGYTKGKTDGAKEQKDKLATINITENGTYTNDNGYKSVIVSIVDDGKYDDGYNDGYDNGYDNGYTSGYTDGVISSVEGSVIKIGEGTKFRYTEFLNTIFTVDCENADDLTGLFYGSVFLTDNGMPLINTSGVTITKQMFCNTNIKVAPYFDTTSVTEAREMFRYCKDLISVPDLVLPSIKSLYGAFYGCEKLVQAPNITVGSGLTDMSYMFNGCSSLESVQLFDTSNVTNMMSVFSGCKGLKEIPQFNTSKVKYTSYMFNGCTSLETIPLLDFSSVIGGFDLKDCKSLTNLGGFQNYIGGDIYLYGSENITRESMVNVFNTIGAIGEANYEINIKQTVYDRLTDDDIAIATNKGWRIFIMK